MKINNRKKKEGREGLLRELLGLLILVLAFLLFIGLVSYSPSDYPNSGSIKMVKNWGGIIGAYISHILYVYSIGYVCLIFPLLLFLFGWNFFLQKPLKSFLRFSIYILGFGILLSTALALPEAVSQDGSKFGYRLSGLLGGFFAENLSQYLGSVGSIVVLLSFMLLLLISATSWSMREAVLGCRDELKILFESIKKESKGKDIPLKREKIEKPSITIHSPQEKQAKVKSHQLDIQTSRHKPETLHHNETQKRPVDHHSVPQKGSVHDRQEPDIYTIPSLSLLIEQLPHGKELDRHLLEEKAHFLEEKLSEFDVRGSVVGIQPGPVITRFEVSPAPGVKVSRFMGIQDDLALVLRAQRVRIVAPIPGKAAVGIEIPNDEATLVTLRGILESKIFQRAQSKLVIGLGQTIDGHPFVTDLTQMPHLLVAGATGSGKSVCLNSIIVSILYRADPSDVKFVLIDPKKLELSLYRKLKKHHLASLKDLNEEVVTTVDNAVSVLRSLEKEMENRYKILARIGVRNIEDYNKTLLEKKPPQNNERPLEKLPYIVLIVDELADLMVTGAREVEEPIARLAQMSRAVGIHLILATQRPSVDVITGVIKANFPSRIAFQVAAKTDSRTILDQNGAEKLLGFGDMLFLHPREPEPIRVHGAFISTEEVQRVVDHVNQQPIAEFHWSLPGSQSKERGLMGSSKTERDELFWEAAKLVVRHQQGSASLLQRRLRIGYARAGRIIDELEEIGILGPFDGSKAREVLIDETDLEKLYQTEMSFSSEDNTL